MASRRTFALAAGPALAAIAWGVASAAGLPDPARWTAAITALCAAWWVLEPIPIPATSLLPFALFPLTGVLDHKDVATAYGHTLILLLLGGFILSTALERSGAHRRLAIGMVRIVGGRGGRRLVLGFMLATALSSMWISNTATTLMMLPVAIAVLEQEESKDLAVPLVLGVAYSASIGGVGTPIGTPPNVIFMGVYRETTGNDLSFLDWMKIGVPVVVLFVPLVWLWLTRRLRQSAPMKLPKLGAWRSPEKRVLVVFVLTAIAWITRQEPFGGWSQWVGGKAVGDSTVALAAIAILFVMPNGEEGGERMLDWETANRIPWGLLILFGGGIAIARGFTASGLSQALGNALSGITAWPLVIMVAAICLSVTFLTEVTSNTATATLLMPVLAAAALGAGIEPALLMAPAAVSASCAFMLPVATAPNAIVFGTERVTTRIMAREGFVLNFVGTMVVTLVCVLLLPK